MNSIISKTIRFAFSSAALITAALLTSCEDEPVKEDTPEVITKVTLTFTPVGGGSTVTVRATDPDGEGVQDITVDGPINLTKNVTYTLSLELINGLASPTDPEYNISEEVEEEADEHMFFFAWTNNTFADPAGNGNVDNRADDVNYNDTDGNGLPLGLSTSWTTVNTTASGTFNVILKHQPGIKTASSTVALGETDVDLTFTLNVN